MADYLFGVANQAVSDNVTNAVETIGSHQEFITIATNLDIRSLADSGGTALSQSQLNKLIQVISERGQPVIMGDTTGTSSPFGIFVMSEHYPGWGAVDLAVPQALGTALAAKIAADGINYGFNGGVFTGSITSTTMTITAVTSGSIGLGSSMTGSGVTSSSYVTAFLTGTGGVGTYTVAASSSATGSITLTAAAGNTATLTSVLT
jgi:hypothetical protein